jgi:hypothetical protein
VRGSTVTAPAAERPVRVDGGDGATNRDIRVDDWDAHHRVAVWRRRYREFGLAGLENGDRSGRSPLYGHDDVLLVKTVTEPPPDAATRWKMEAIARRLGDEGVAGRTRLIRSALRCELGNAPVVGMPTRLRSA